MNPFFSLTTTARGLLITLAGVPFSLVAISSSMLTYDTGSMVVMWSFHIALGLAVVGCMFCGQGASMPPIRNLVWAALLMHIMAWALLSLGHVSILTGADLLASPYLGRLLACAVPLHMLGVAVFGFYMIQVALLLGVSFHVSGSIRLSVLVVCGSVVDLAVVVFAGHGVVTLRMIALLLLLFDGLFLLLLRRAVLRAAM
jgi:hypothetical protein